MSLQTNAQVRTFGAPPLSNVCGAVSGRGRGGCQETEDAPSAGFRRRAGDQKKRVALLDTGGSAQPLLQTPAQFSDLHGSLWGRLQRASGWRRSGVSAPLLLLCFDLSLSSLSCWNPSFATFANSGPPSPAPSLSALSRFSPLALSPPFAPSWIPRPWFAPYSRTAGDTVENVSSTHSLSPCSLACPPVTPRLPNVWSPAVIHFPQGPSRSHWPRVNIS